MHLSQTAPYLQSPNLYDYELCNHQHPCPKQKRYKMSIHSLQHPAQVELERELQQQHSRCKRRSSFLCRLVGVVFSRYDVPMKMGDLWRLLQKPLVVKMRSPKTQYNVQTIESVSGQDYATAPIMRWSCSSVFRKIQRIESVSIQDYAITPIMRWSCSSIFRKILWKLILIPAW